MRAILASIELSQTIKPSWLLKNTPPRTALCLSSKLYSLIHNVEFIYFPVSVIIILVKFCSQSLKAPIIKSRCYFGASMATFFSIIRSIPYFTDNLLEPLTWKQVPCNEWHQKWLLSVFPWVLLEAYPQVKISLPFSEFSAD